MTQQDPHKPLRQDVRLLGEMLGETLRIHAGAGCSIPSSASVASPSAPVSGRNFDDLRSRFPALPVDATIALARAFTHFLNLANVAEQHHRIRRRRAYRAMPGPAPQRGSCEETFARLVTDGLSPRTRCHERSARSASSWC